MNFKFLKATFASLLILTSTANAGVIDVDFTSLDAAGDFNAAKGQNIGSYNVVDNVLTLDTNSWFSVDLVNIIGVNSIDYANTILSFDFMSSGISEIGGVSATNTNAADSSSSFNVIGSQNWNLFDNKTDAISEWVHFDINLGDYLTGEFSKIGFINDCDNCSGLDITASFKNMSVSSDDISEVPEPTTLALFALATFGLVSRRVKR